MPEFYIIVPMVSVATTLIWYLIKIQVTGNRLIRQIEANNEFVRIILEKRVEQARKAAAKPVAVPEPRTRRIVVED